MPSAFQEGVKLFLWKSKNSDANSSESSSRSSRSTGESSSSGPSPKRKEHSSVSGIVSAFGGCFAQPNTHGDLDLIAVSSFQENSLCPFKVSTNQENDPGVRVFAMGEIIRATNNFSPSMKIGQGGFGTVYKGKLRNGDWVAIKRAKKNTHDVRPSTEFHNEVATLSNIEHLNLVKFIGYAQEGPEHIVVVEYVANGNLREHLDVQHGIVLDLATRLDIAIDIAHAITYLHLYADQSIIHRDIKSSNVLLTENFRAKVTDFGFSRPGPVDLDATHVSTQVKGTAGYLDPEYLKTYQLTQKSDVYSFGILLVELFTGRRPLEQKRDSSERITARWAFQMFIDGQGIEVLDPNLERSSSACMMVEKILELAFRCAAPTKLERPSMKQTTEVLWNIRKDYQTFWRLRSGIISPSQEK